MDKKAGNTTDDLCEKHRTDRDGELFSLPYAPGGAEE